MEAAPGRRVGDRPGDCRRRQRVPARSERRLVAWRLADVCGHHGAVPACARRPRAPRFFRRARARGRPAETDGRVRPQPISARVAIPPRARRRVSGHQPGAMGSGRAVDTKLERRVGRVRRRAAALDLHRRRSQAVDLRVSRRRGRPARRGRAVHRDAAAAIERGGYAPCACPSASGRPRRCLDSSTTCSARLRATRRAALTRSGTASSIDSRCRSMSRSPEPGARSPTTFLLASSSGPRFASPPRPWPTKSCGC